LLDSDRRLGPGRHLRAHHGRALDLGLPDPVGAGFGPGRTRAVRGQAGTFRRSGVPLTHEPSLRRCPVRSRCVLVEGLGAGAILTCVPGTWRDLELGAPQIARLGRDRINAARVAMLGTLRHDGSPRISPVEPHVAEGQLLVGAIAWSRKAADLRRDPRFVLHSAVTGPDSGEGELKLYGSAMRAGPHLHGAMSDAWWSAWPPDRAIVFSLRIDQAVFIEWDIERALMTVHRWSQEAGYSQASRTYP